MIVELKQWEETERSYVDDCVVTFVGGRLRDQLHPSKQVGKYQRYLLDVHTVFSNALVGLQACSYLHNLIYAESAELFDQRHGHLFAANPLFAGDQVDAGCDVQPRCCGTPMTRSSSMLSTRRTGSSP